MGAGTNGRRRLGAGRFGAGQQSHAVYAVITPDRPCNRGRVADEQGSGLKEGVSARRHLTASHCKPIKLPQSVAIGRQISARPLHGIKIARHISSQ